MRDSLVAQVKPVLDQGEKILKDSPTVMQASLAKTAGTTAAAGGTGQTNALPGGIQVVATDTPESVKAKISQAYTNTYPSSLDIALNDVPAQEEPGKHTEFAQKLNAAFQPWLTGLNDPGLAAAFKQANFTAGPETTKAAYRERVVQALAAELASVLASFDDATLKEVQARLQLSKQEWNTLQGSLDNTGFDLFPKQGWRWEHEDGGGTSIWLHNFFGMLWSRHLFGMVLSALLLSLGAPFWFNTLKSLASLRSCVATNISDEDKAQLKNPNAAPASKVPPTVK